MAVEQEARDFGLIGPVSQPARLSEAYNLFEWKLVEWSVLPELLPVWVGMLFVVAFSSTLDVAAIEIGTVYSRRLNVTGFSSEGNFGTA